MRRIFENAAVILFVIFVAIGLGYSLYTGFLSPASEKTDKAIENQVRGCEKALARATVFENFAREAASARRAQAAADQKAGNTISAKNNLATAERYESFARQWDALTVHNCQAEYGQS